MLIRVKRKKLKDKTRAYMTWILGAPCRIRLEEMTF